MKKVLKKIKKHTTCEKTFELFDKAKIGYLTINGIQSTLSEFYDMHLTKAQFLTVIKYMNPSENGIITLKEFHNFYYELENKLQNASKDMSNLGLEEIAKSLLDVIKERGLTLLEIFMQIDTNRNGYITTEDFALILKTIGFIISEEKLKELLKEDNSNFDDKISYELLNRYIKTVAGKYGADAQLDECENDRIFSWRDKGIESLLKSLNTITKDYTSYFERFDSNHNGWLTPKDFREAMSSLRSLNTSQIERLLVSFVIDKNYQPLVSIKQLSDILTHRMNTSAFARQMAFTEKLLVDEELFVTIFQHFDGLTVLSKKAYNLYETSTYLTNHITDFEGRGCTLLSNNLMLKRMLICSRELILNLKDVFANIGNNALELIRTKFKREVLEEHKRERPIALKDEVHYVDIPSIDPNKVSFDKKSNWTLPSGCVCYKGIYEVGNVPIRIQMYSARILSKVSDDGRLYKKHLDLELNAQIMLYAKYPDLTFKVLGKFEKKIGIGENAVEQYIVFEDIPSDEYICLDDFLDNNGGLLDIPILKNTEIGLYIAKLWLSDILKGLHSLHLVGFVMRTLSTSHLYLKKTTSTIKFGHFRGVGRVDNLGRVNYCPDVTIHSAHTNLGKVYDNPYIPPEILTDSLDRTEMMDVWGLGAVFHAILIGQSPKSYLSIYKMWAKSHNALRLKPLTLPIISLSEETFMYSPIQFLENEGTERGWNNKRYLQEVKKECNIIVNALKTCSYSSVTQGFTSAQPFNNPALKTAVGELLDCIACCLCIDPAKRPLIPLLLESKLIHLDTYELASAAKFIKSMNLYKSPSLCVTLKAKIPLREFCLVALKSPEKLLTELETPLLQVIDRVINHVHTIITPYTEMIRNVMIDNEQSDSPHSPLAKQIITDKVIDMLIFLCHRYTRMWLFKNHKENTLKLIEAENTSRKNTRFGELEILVGSETKVQSPTKGIIKTIKETMPKTARGFTKTKFVDYDQLKKQRERELEEKKRKTLKEKKGRELIEAKKKFETSTIRAKRGIALRLKEENRVLSAMCYLIHKLMVEMQSRSSVMAPYVKNLLEYLIKLLIGEDSALASDLITQVDGYSQNTLFNEPAENLLNDSLNQQWTKMHQNMPLTSYETFWDFNIYSCIFPIFEESVGTSGLGGGHYVVIHEFIQQCNAEMELSSSFGKKSNLGKNRTSEYYSEVHRLCEAIVILTEDTYGVERKREELARICSVFYGGNLECARAALDLRVTKYIHMCLQSTDYELRNYSLLIMLQLSKALAIDLELEANTKELAPQDSIEDKSLLNYIYGRSAISNPTDMGRYIKLAKELPSIHFEQNREIFRALGTIFKSPVFTSTLTKLLKDSLESIENKYKFSGPSFIRSLNSAVVDTYFTLAKLLRSRINNPNDQLVREIKEMFPMLFELRDPAIDCALLNNRVAKDIINECGINIPVVKSFQDLLETVENLWTTPAPDETALLNKQKIPALCKDLKSLLLYTNEAEKSEARDNFIRTAIEVLCRATDVSWDAFKQSRLRAQHKEVLQSVIDIWELLITKGMYAVILGAKKGNLIGWILLRVTQALTESGAGKESELLVIAMSMQRVLVLLLKANNELINEALESLSFGQVFGQHLQLQYESLKLVMTSKSDQYYERYPSQNYLRLSQFRYLLRSNSEKLKSQFLKSRFIERMITEYVKNVQRFNTKFDKIDLKFLAFNHCYPLRSESIEFINEISDLKERASVIYPEFIQRVNMHLLPQHECQIIETYETKPEYLVQTALLLVTIMVKTIPEITDKEEKLKSAVNEIMMKKPILKKQFSELASKLRL